MILTICFSIEMPLGVHVIELLNLFWKKVPGSAMAMCLFIYFWQISMLLDLPSNRALMGIAMAVLICCQILKKLICI